MYLKYLLRQMEKQIKMLTDIEQKAELFNKDEITAQNFENFLCSYKEQREALERSHKELLQHHNQATLFLESLFREQHFKEGQLVLKPTQCFVRRVIEVHGGKVGCEATPEGNNFYFILPLPGTEVQKEEVLQA